MAAPSRSAADAPVHHAIANPAVAVTIGDAAAFRPAAAGTAPSTSTAGSGAARRRTPLHLFHQRVDVILSRQRRLDGLRLGGDGGADDRGGGLGGDTTKRGGEGTGKAGEQKAAAFHLRLPFWVGILS